MNTSPIDGNPKLPNDHPNDLNLPKTSFPLTNTFKMTIILGILFFLLLTFVSGMMLDHYFLKPQSPTNPEALTLPTTPPLPSPTPNLSSESGQNAIANWKTFTSTRCAISVKYPPDWKAEDIQLVPGTDNPNYNFGCITITAPDYKMSGDSTPEGMYLSILRSTKGATFKKIVINNIDDYILAIENIAEPKVKAKNVQIKKYGSIMGKYFESSFFTTSSSFVFEKGNYIYEIGWPTNYTGNYKNNNDQILSTFKFL